MKKRSIRDIYKILFDLLEQCKSYGLVMTLVPNGSRSLDRLSSTYSPPLEQNLVITSPEKIRQLTKAQIRSTHLTIHHPSISILPSTTLVIRFNSILHPIPDLAEYYVSPLSL
ncbi:MAG: hypothetical protein ACO29Y_06470 [Holophagaceae bacterium]|jgi:hypothetical protein